MLKAYITSNKILEQHKALNFGHLVAQKDALDKFLKAKNSNLYYKNLYIEYYHFHLQCKDYFETVVLKSHKRTSFANSFFWKKQFFTGNSIRLGLSKTDLLPSYKRNLKLLSKKSWRVLCIWKQYLR